jgi:hypothetical protein
MNTFWLLVTIALVIWLPGSIFYYVFLLPYRNQFMIWYTKKYSKEYLEAKKIHDGLHMRLKECRSGTLSLQECYYKFLEYMREHPKFRSSEQIRKKLRNDSVDMTLENMESVIEDIPDIESFVAFVGKGTDFHKIVVIFFLVDTVHLQCIQLFYHEEMGQLSFFFPLEETKFPPDDPDNGKRLRRKLIFPPPIQRPRKKIVLLEN